MENINQPEKSLWSTIKGTLQGINNEGSAKRATTFFFVAIFLSSLLAVYEYGVIIAIQAPVPTVIHIQLVKYYPEVFWSLLITILTLLGFATLELITALVKKVTGGNTPDKPTNQETK